MPRASVRCERATVVWLGLMAATVISTWLLAKDLVAPDVAFVALVVVAALKVRYVLLDFMELRTAPRGARIAFEVWTVAIAVVILGFHFVPG